MCALCNASSIHSQNWLVKAGMLLSTAVDLEPSNCCQIATPTPYVVRYLSSDLALDALGGIYTDAATQRGSCAFGCT